VPTYTHIAYMSNIDPKSSIEAYIRLIGYAGATGAHMHICHFNSDQPAGCRARAALVRKAQRRGCRSRSRPIPTAPAPPCWRRLLQSTRNSSAPAPAMMRAELVTTGIASATGTNCSRRRQEILGTLVLWHFLDTENNDRHRELLDISVMYPGGAIASDAMPWSAAGRLAYRAMPGRCRRTTAHPRSSGHLHPLPAQYGCGARHHVAAGGIAKCTLIPAQIVEASTPLRGKGRLQPGADADIVVFDSRP
jgi:hypothetical protein